MERIYVNVGKRDGFFAGNLIELLNRQIQGKRIDVGRIDLLPAYTLFDVNKKTPAKSSGALTGTDFFGKRLHSEIADPARDYTRLADKKKTKIPLTPTLSPHPPLSSSPSLAFAPTSLLIPSPSLSPPPLSPSHPPPIGPTSLPIPLPLSTLSSH